MIFVPKHALLLVLYTLVSNTPIQKRSVKLHSSLPFCVRFSVCWCSRRASALCFVVVAVYTRSCSPHSSPRLRGSGGLLVSDNLPAILTPPEQCLPSADQILALKHGVNILMHFMWWFEHLLLIACSSLLNSCHGGTLPMKKHIFSLLTHSLPALFPFCPKIFSLASPGLSSGVSLEVILSKTYLSTL